MARKKTKDVKAIRERVRNMANLRFRAMVPNLLTLVCAWSGMIAIRNASEGRFDHAMIALFVASIFDGLDGRIARNWNVESDFGVILDSLADFLSFGVAPAMVLFYWGQAESNIFLWPACLFYAACCALRLARFSISVFQDQNDSTPTRFFFGIPAPMAMAVAVLPLASFLFLEKTFDLKIAQVASAAWWHNILIVPVLLFVGVMMISKVPTFSMKNIRFMGRHRLFVWFFSILLVFGLIENIWLTWLAVVLTYLMTIFFTVRLYRSSKAQ